MNNKTLMKSIVSLGLLTACAMSFAGTPKHGKFVIVPPQPLKSSSVSALKSQLPHLKGPHQYAYVSNVVNEDEEGPVDITVTIQEQGGYTTSHTYQDVPYRNGQKIIYTKTALATSVVVRPEQSPDSTRFTNVDTDQVALFYGVGSPDNKVF